NNAERNYRRNNPRHGGLHVAGASQRQRSGQADRHLDARLCLLRVVNRQAGFFRRYGRRDHRRGVQIGTGLDATASTTGRRVKNPGSSAKQACPKVLCNQCSFLLVLSVPHSANHSILGWSTYEELLTVRSFGRAVWIATGDG